MLLLCYSVKAIADVGMAVVERLEQQYAEVLAPLRKSKIHAKCGPKFVQKLVRGSVCLYSVSEEVKSCSASYLVIAFLT